MMKNKIISRIWEAITVIVILLFLCGLFLYLNEPSSRMKEAKTEVIIRKIECALLLYFDKYSHYPGKTNTDIAQALRRRNKDNFDFLPHEEDYKSGQINDAWGVPLKIIESEKILIIKSSGKNKIFNDEDDIKREIVKPTANER